MKNTIFILVIAVITFSSFFAQEVKNKSDENTKSGSIKTPNETQAANEKVEFKNETGNSILTITDEGNNKGSITLPVMSAAPSNTSNKLYNEGGTLKFNGSSLGSGNGAGEINSLTDAKYDGSSLFLGSGSGANDDETNNQNTAIGKNALFSNLSGSSNTAIGFEALNSNTSGSSNLAFGSFALNSNIDGSNNIAIGHQALNGNTDGSFNMAIGTFSLFSNTTGESNLGIGYRTGFHNSTGIRNVVYGQEANFFNTSGSFNTIIGFNAGRGTSHHFKSGNIFIGYQAGYNEIGSNKLYLENSNSNSPLIWGDFALDSLQINGNLHVTGNITSDGLSIGAAEINDLADAKTNSNNLYLGSQAGNSDNGTPTSNTALGILALYGNTANGNTAVGKWALSGNISGASNTGIGSDVMLNNTTGNSNVAIGGFANYFNQEGSNNTIIGVEAGRGTAVHSKSGNVFIGHQAGYNEIRDNRLYIENSNSDKPLIYGNFESDSVKINGRAHVTTSLSVGSQTKAIVPNSVAFGENTETHGLSGLAAGKDNLSWGFYSSAFGLGTRAMAYVGTAIGRYNVGSALAVFSEWNETDPIFEIGNGTDNANRSNALTVLKNGNVGIGPSAPTASLHVDAVNGVVFNGLTTGEIPIEGSGSRMMWYQGKSAFRAGSVQTQWDDTNIGSYSTAFNYRTTASGTYSFAAGYQTEASGQRSTAMGSNTIASGLHSTALGSNTEATGDFSTSIGRYVRAAGNGTIFIGDNSVNTIQQATIDNRFAARFANGYKFYTNSTLTSGAEMLAGANSWSTVSDSTKKDNFLKVDGEEVLSKISNFNLRSWNYKGQDPTKFRHYGPMAQEFFTAFGNDGIGTIGNDTTIASADFDGINFIAIQALEKRTKEQEISIKNQLSSIESLVERINELEKEKQELAMINMEFRKQNQELKNVNFELQNDIKLIKSIISNFEKEQQIIKTAELN